MVVLTESEIDKTGAFVLGTFYFHCEGGRRHRGINEILIPSVYFALTGVL